MVVKNQVKEILTANVGSSTQAVPENNEVRSNKGNKSNAKKKTIIPNLPKHIKYNLYYKFIIVNPLILHISETLTVLAMEKVKFYVLVLTKYTYKKSTIYISLL